MAQSESIDINELVALAEILSQNGLVSPPVRSWGNDSVYLYVALREG